MAVSLFALLPHHALSRFMGWLAERRWGIGTRWGIRWFIRHYAVDMSEALVEDYRQYPTFNAFFTRQLKANARPLADSRNAIISPMDGFVSALGTLQGDDLLQAKGKHYRLADLLGGDQEEAERFRNGLFFTGYLAPKDYHRVHMPVTGRLLKMIYVPGRLFPVHFTSVSRVSGLFNRNERLICLFDTAVGPMAIILVGAFLVGNITTVWTRRIRRTNQRRVLPIDENTKNKVLQRGQEMGYFKMGSTVIVLFQAKAIQWERVLAVHGRVKMGGAIAQPLFCEEKHGSEKGET
ncbi:MAG: phosphatidylserine decarboxylase [Coxiella sp. RIFCSPHIGHO2_12_FULL_44_14]|nr:MAG: phosphatidylserine decarboxylase [Coxiella sp. RIFCSPHIGHO2_12_FULL_44_14]